MSGNDPSDDEGPQRIRFVCMPASELPDARERVMSWSAHDVQVRATAHSASCGHPGFVPYEYLEQLNGLGIQATITAGELCTVGLWEHVSGSYRLLGREAVEVCLDQVRQHTGQDPQFLAGEPEHAATDWAQMAKPSA